MKGFDEIRLDFEACRAEYQQFQNLLQSKGNLSERDDILPFFKQRRQLAVLMGMFNSKINWADRIAFEYDIFGDFACDLAVGEWDKGCYCFVEFEDANEESVFFRHGKKQTREWARRFEHGFSQIVDWVYELDHISSGQGLNKRFSKHSIQYETVLVIGRDQHIDDAERQRLAWRFDRVSINSRKVSCMTFDQLCVELGSRI